VTEPRPLRADARRTYERLVDAARDAFTEHGTDAKLDDIARRAGVGAGTLYRHFPDRETLLAAVYRSDIEELATAAYELLDRLPPGAALDEWMRVQVDYVRRKRGLGACLIAAYGRDSELFGWCRDRIGAAASALLDAARADGTVLADIDGRDLLRLGHGIAVATEYGAVGSDRLVEIMLAGLRSPTGGRPV
jgi:AcrR family transcriptional regulator